MMVLPSKNSAISINCSSFLYQCHYALQEIGPFYINQLVYSKSTLKLVYLLFYKLVLRFFLTCASLKMLLGLFLSLDVNMYMYYVYYGTYIYVYVYACVESRSIFLNCSQRFLSQCHALNLELVQLNWLAGESLGSSSLPSTGLQIFSTLTYAASTLLIEPSLQSFYKNFPCT